MLRLAHKQIEIDIVIVVGLGLATVTVCHQVRQTDSRLLPTTLEIQSSHMKWMVVKIYK